MPRLTKQQREYRRTMKELKKEGKVRDKYGSVVKPEKFRLDLSLVLKVLISLYVVYMILSRFFGLGILMKAYFGGGEEYAEGDDYAYEQTAESERIYTFKKADQSLFNGGSEIINVYPDGNMLEHSKFMGQVITLFGQPDNIENDYENIFTTMVSAEDKDGNILYLYVYHGPSGPAIGGQSDENSRRAAAELADLIKNTAPSDYDWKGVYEDFDITIKMGVRNGVPYYDDNAAEVLGQ